MKNSDYNQYNKHDKYGDPYVWAQVVDNVLVAVFTDKELIKEQTKLGKKIPGIVHCKWAGKVE